MSNKKNDNNEKSDLARNEEQILQFWDEHNIFEKSVEHPAGFDEPKDEFVFYDGPPFATGTPHYGHILAGTIKDVIPRFKTMQGYRVRRRWGWDCHGLPLENKVEAHLDLETKKDIQEYGIDTFNEEAKEFVLGYTDEWKEIIPRTGRWVDMEDDYRTMDTDYSESVWWAFENLWEKDLIYEGYKSMHICPRCETPLSNFEVNQGYEDIKDFAVTVKFRLQDAEDTYLLAWTTTPWTLPGNTGVAVNPDIDYVKATVTKGEYKGETYILAKDRLEETFGHSALTKGDGVKKDSWTGALDVTEVDIEEYVGDEYLPPFDYFLDADMENKENAWKVWTADFVTKEDGTGIVHLAPAYGQEDMELQRTYDMPVLHHVRMDGRFKESVRDFAGEPVKPRDDHMSTDVEIIKHLAHADTLVSKNKIEHSYPHCWRCDTPLLNYATDSWFVEVTEYKDELIEENEDVGWVPEAIGENRFGNWLEGAQDWAISRDRFWGAPLPVWQSQDSEKTTVIGSLEELQEKTQSNNNFWAMRHAKAEHNDTEIIDSDDPNTVGLTEIGEDQAASISEELSDVDVIFTSPFRRCKETAGIIADSFTNVDIQTDQRLAEYDFGEFDGMHKDEYHRWRDKQEGFYTTKVPGGESFLDLKCRAGEFLYDIDEKFEKTNILIVSHGWFLEVLPAILDGADIAGSEELYWEHKYDPGYIRSFTFSRMPHNNDFEWDLHRPYIDEVTWENDDGQTMERIDAVFDCWFESGSMPYASYHYPFETDRFNPETETGYPANFIAEGLDQTRGWFYSLLVLGTALFDESPYENVIVNGMVLNADGEAMSKSKGNFPPITDILDEYGADAMRYHLLNSPGVRADEVRFSEDGVDEVVKKLIYRLNNVYSFYEMYTNDGIDDALAPHDIEALENVLDAWTVSRLHQVRDTVTDNLESYALDRAARPLMAFVDDLSTWYIRRSRDRFRNSDGQDKEAAKATTVYVLEYFVRLLAPFMPFTSEDLYQELTQVENAGISKESVHLSQWPSGGAVDEKLLQQMQRVRDIVSDALDLRSQAGIKVRQPLSTLAVAGESPHSVNKEQLIDLIHDEVNVKSVVFDADIEESVALETEITQDLKEEGMVRELIRNIQKLRKKQKLDPQERVTLIVDAGDSYDLIEEHQAEIKETTGLEEITYQENDGMEVQLDDTTVELSIQ